MDTQSINQRYQSYLKLYAKNKHYPSIVKMSFEEWLENDKKYIEQCQKAHEEWLERQTKSE